MISISLTGSFDPHPPIIPRSHPPGADAASFVTWSNAARAAERALALPSAAKNKDAAPASRASSGDPLTSAVAAGGFFLFSAYMSHAFAGAGSPEVEDGCFGIHFGLLLD